MMNTIMLLKFLCLNIFINPSTLIGLKKRKGYIRILEYLKIKSDYQYSIAKKLTMSIGNVCNYCKDLEEFNLIQSKIENKIGKRKVRIYSINKDMQQKINEFIGSFKR